MLRSLPPAGHPISVRCALSALAGTNGARDPLCDLFGQRLYYLSSGTAALTLSLAALKRSGRHKIVFPAYTCPSLLASVLKAGLTPVLCDIEPQGFRMVPEQLEVKLDRETLGIIAVHLFGIPERLETIRRIASGRDIAVVEDATQALGGKYSGPGKDGALLGAIGDLGVLSFRRGKPVSFLAGGAVVVNNREYEQTFTALYDSLEPVAPQPALLPYVLQLLMYSVLFHPRLFWLPQGLPWLRLGKTVFTTNYSVGRLNPRVLNIAPRICAEMERERQTRSRLAGAYSEVLEQFRDEFLFLPQKDDQDNALLRYPVVFKKKRSRDRALARLQERRMGASPLYPAPVNEIAGVPRQFGAGRFPNARFVSENILTLPLHGHVGRGDVAAITSEIIRSL